MNKGPPPPPPAKPATLQVHPAPALKLKSDLESESHSELNPEPIPATSTSTNSFSASDAAEVARKSGGIKARLAQLGFDSSNSVSSSAASNATGSSLNTTRATTPVQTQTQTPNQSASSLTVPSSTLLFGNHSSNSNLNGSAIPGKQKKKAPPPPPSRNPSLRDDAEYPPRPSPSPSVSSFFQRRGSRDSQEALSSNQQYTIQQQQLQQQPLDSSAVPPARLRRPRQASIRRIPATPDPSSSTTADSPTPTTIAADIISLAPSTIASATATATIPKREMIVREIIDSEKSYLDDLRVMKEIYVDTCIEQGILPMSDVKLLFGNIDALIGVSETVYDTLINATNGIYWDDENVDSGGDSAARVVGSVFLELAPIIDENFKTYCKNNEQQMTRLFDYSSPEASEAIRQFWKDCQARLRGRTNAWDLSSLIIKPVQRVLKYPLLLSQLLKETKESNITQDGSNGDVGGGSTINDDSSSEVSGHSMLLRAFNEMSRIAEEINDLKRRKDTVEKYVEGKGGLNVIHGISKKFTRGIEELKHVTKVVDGTKDEQYDEIYEKFNHQHIKAITFSRELTIWVKCVKEVLEAQELLATSFEEVYMVSNGSGSGGGISSPTTANSSGNGHGILAGISTRSLSTWSMKRRSADASVESVNTDASLKVGSAVSLHGHVLTVGEYRRVCAKLAYEPWKDAENRVKTQIIPCLNTLFNRLKDPLLLIKKRESKLLDHDRVKRMRAKSELIEKSLEESAEAYTSINAELIAELPKLTALMTQYLDIVVGEFVAVQMQVYEQVAAGLRNVGGGMFAGTGSVVDDYNQFTATDEEVAWRVWDITILENWRDEVWRNDETEDTQQVLSNLGRTHTSSTQATNSKAVTPSATRRGSVAQSYLSRGGGFGGGTESIKTTRTNNGWGGAGDTEDGTAAAPLSQHRFSFFQKPFGSPKAVVAAVTHVASPTPSLFRMSAFEVEALYAFKPELDDEMEMNAGDVVWINATSGRNGDYSNQDWWYAISSDGTAEGWVPGNYVRQRRK
ncbi:hypothetical protein HK100_004219 [Physocladia obscura]|uniref:Dynamin-binding protein n=1 Tax=Physocladia obscura TaxID=109957 RepID=A0AAD5T842_9FUNG|nr:hypothetical protein HK100_004219 [Physocladia obscura]